MIDLNRWQKLIAGAIVLISSTILVYAFFNGTGIPASSGRFSSNAGASAGLTTNQLPTNGWARGCGGSSYNYGQTLTVRPSSGNIIFGGIFAGTTDFGNGVLTSAGGNDIVLAEYTPAGACLWLKRFGGPGNESVLKVAVDGSGSIFITGTFQNTFSLGSITLTNVGGNDIYVAKFASTNLDQPLWAKAFGSARADVINSFAVDGNGDVFLVGNFTTSCIWGQNGMTGGLSFGGDTLCSTSSGQDSFVAKLSGVDGRHLWSRNFTCGSPDDCKDLAVNLQGDVVVIGSYQGDIDFGLGYMTSSGLGSDAYMAKLSGASGQCLWNKSFGGTYGDAATSIALDAAGNVFLAGYFYTTINFGGSNLVSSSQYDVFLAKFSSADGGHLWSTAFNGPASEYPTALAVDPAGNALVTGTFQNTLSVAGTILTSLGTSSSFLTKHSNSGALISARVIGGYQKVAGSENTTVAALATDGSGNIILAGNFQGTLDAGGGLVLINDAVQDAFLIKLILAQSPPFAVKYQK